MAMAGNEIESNLHRLGELLPGDREVELLLIGGAAGMLTGELVPNRTTGDCDVIRYDPPDAEGAVLETARSIARARGLPENWLNSQAKELDIRPDGWRSRRVLVGSYGRLKVYALSRRDLLATKFHGGHPRDIEDITVMQPTADELAFVRIYLNMLRVPSRKADLDSVAASLKLVDAFEDKF